MINTADYLVLFMVDSYSYERNSMKKVSFALLVFELDTKAITTLESAFPQLRVYLSRSWHVHGTHKKRDSNNNDVLHTHSVRLVQSIFLLTKFFKLGNSTKTKPTDVTQR